MKKVKLKSLVVCLLAVLFFVSSLNAALIDNGDGTITDTDINRMWIKDFNYADTSGFDLAWDGTWEGGRMPVVTARAWVEQLSMGGYTDWRLPSQFDMGGSHICVGFECSLTEMGHLYHIEGVSQATPGLFINVGKDYWFADPPIGAGEFRFSDGGQSNNNGGGDHFATAVRDCGGSCPTTVVPEPSSIILFLVGSTLLVVRRFYRGKKFKE